VQFTYLTYKNTVLKYKRNL